MEDEVRVILRQAAEETGREALDRIDPPTDSRRGARAPAAEAATKRILL